jgi:hypothetical protein
MTIAFLSLFFGLITGPYPVELSVHGPVAAVELLMDGRSVRTLQGPPWKTEIDFGQDLQPHEIVARALDAGGKEIARVQEWANLPHPLSKVDIALEEDPLGPPKAAKVLWTDLKGEKPGTRSLTFDGAPVTLDPAGRAILPPHNLASLHLLEAKVAVPSGRSARKEIAYGGEYGSEVSTELTAVPVRTEGGKLPPARQLSEWLTAGGRPLPVAAVEEGPAQLYVVRSPGTPDALLDIVGATAKDDFKMVTISNIWAPLKLGKESAVRIVYPFTRRYEGSGELLTDLFTVTTDLDTRVQGLPWVLLTGNRVRLRPGARLRFADAVAVAGLEATTENRRRAVLLVLSAKEKEQSRYVPATVRRYLAALRVPLVVWCLGEPEPGSAAAAWGKVEVLKNERELERAVGALRKLLESERILMVDGLHLPQSITLSSQASGVELAGAR